MTNLVRTDGYNAINDEHIFRWDIVVDGKSALVHTEKIYREDLTAKTIAQAEKRAHAALKAIG